MASTPSTTPDITETLPTLLSARTASSQVASQTGCRFDVAIGGISFLSAASDQRPYVRQSAPISKQQFDNSKEAGEQTLDQYWIRSQVSWHHGAGIKFYEPGSDPTTEYRFEKSMGVDVWTQGQLDLLNRTALAGAVTTGQVAYATTGRLSDGTNCVFTNENGTVKRRSGTGAALATYTNPTSGAPASKVHAAATSILVGTSTAVAKGANNGSALTDLWTGAPSAPTPFWAKSRIIAATGNKLWELTLTGGGAWPTAGNELFVHPDTSWTWTSVCEAPGAILAAGYGGGQGAIFKFTLQDASSGQTPKLSQGYQVAEFPPGEEVHSIRVYLGAYIGIGTSKGLRVGLVDSQSPYPTVTGNINYGPLLLTTTQPVRSLSARDTFLYAGVEADLDGGSGVVRVNLSEQIIPNSLRFPWAYDAQTHDTGRVDSVAFVGNTDQLVIGVLGKGVYVQSATLLEQNAYLVSGRVRYATVEPKSFRLADVRANMSFGTVKFSTVDENGNTTFIRSLTPSAADGGNLAIDNAPSGLHEFIQVRLDLLCDTPGTGSPVVNSVQLKALPFPKRQRLIQFPLLCFDQEEDAMGVKFGREGFSWARIQGLEAAEDAGVTVLVQDFLTGEVFDAVVEKVEFDRKGPRPSKNSRQNQGGYLNVLVRKL